MREAHVVMHLDSRIITEYLSRLTSSRPALDACDLRKVAYDTQWFAVKDIAWLFNVIE